MLTAYMDESYSDGILMCVGGWLGTCERWDVIQKQWQKRIDFENRLSAKKKIPAISRYHASDLQSDKSGEFREWTRPRRILFTKKLIDILGRGNDRLKNPIAIACGLKLPDVPVEMRIPDNVFKNHWAAYRLCMMQNLLTLAEVMKHAFPEEQVAVIYDRGPFGGAAQSAFDSFKKTSSKDKTKYVVTMAPMGGEDCTALQPADLIAFEGRKLVGSHNRDPYYFRRSLKRLLGNGNFVRVREITKGALEGILEASKMAPPKPDDWKI